MLAGSWSPFAKRCFLVEKRVEVYSQALGFKAPPASSKIGQEFRFEIQESTSKAIAILFLLFPLGALATKTVEYINNPDLDWAHRQEFLDEAGASAEEGAEGFAQDAQRLAANTMKTGQEAVAEGRELIKETQQAVQGVQNAVGEVQQTVTAEIAGSVQGIADGVGDVVSDWSHGIGLIIMGQKNPTDFHQVLSK